MKKKAVSREKPRQQERAVEQEPTVTIERAAGAEQSVSRKRADCRKSTVEGERAVVDESTNVSERADPGEPTGIAERAGVREPSDEAERAESLESPVWDERAVDDEPTADEERAEPAEPPIPCERGFPGWPIDALRVAVRSFYDAQKLRIMMANRLERAPNVTDEWRERLLSRGLEFAAVERHLLQDIEKLLPSFPVFPWLKAVKGCGPTMSAVLISELADPRKAPRPSNLWSFAGLNVLNLADGEALAGQAPGMKNVKALMAARKGEGEEDVRRPWNAFLRTKLVGVLGPSFLKCGSSYRLHYDNTRQRYLERSILRGREVMGPAWVETVRLGGLKGNEALEKARAKTSGAVWNAAHIHQAAIRYMVKMFLLDFWREWRSTAGLPVVEPYHEAKLGMRHAV